MSHKFCDEPLAVYQRFGAKRAVDELGTYGGGGQVAAGVVVEEREVSAGGAASGRRSGTVETGGVTRQTAVAVVGGVV